MFVATALAATSCMVWNPHHTKVTPANWGAEITPTVRDMPYAPTHMGCGRGAARHDKCGGSTTLDIYRRVSGAPRGTIVFIHGGGFLGGDKSVRDEFGPILRQTHRGWDVVSINYRLSDPATGVNLFPAAIQDVAAATTWVRGHGPSRGLTATRVVTAGHSAGGTLAALAGVAANNHHSPISGTTAIDGYISIAGIHNFNIGPSSRFWGLQWTGQHFHTHWGQASPATWLDAGDPPGFLIHGDRDHVVEVAGAYEFHQRAMSGGFGANVSLDITDNWANGAPLADYSRSHTPMGGSNSEELDNWLNSL